MPVPDVQTLLLPTLRALAGGADTSTVELRRHIAADLRLTPGDLRELPLRSPVTKFKNRVAWALVHLQRAGLVAKVRKSIYRLTPDGTRLLADPPTRLNRQFLRDTS